MLRRPIRAMTDPQSHFPRSGFDLLHDPRWNKGTAFTAEERERCGLRGLLPPRIFSQAEQQRRVLEGLRREPDPLRQYVYLSALAERNETLFYRLLCDHIEETMPIVYTPTVGEACQKFGNIFQRARGLFLSIEDRGRVRDVLRNWPEQDVRVLVVTDGGRILGLGDLGAHGMGIPVGKLTLYTVCAGLHPRRCLPVTIDVGTDNAALRSDPLYIGLQRPRSRGPEYDELLDEFVAAVQELHPRALIQFEDFSNSQAFRQLERFRDRVCCFNDDIQGTAAVTLAGLYASRQLTGRALADEKLLFLGAGEAGIGIAELVTAALRAEGLSDAAARRRCWLIDSQGLVTAGRDGLGEHKSRFAHEHPPLRDLHSIVQALRPTALIGVCGRPQSFTEPVVRALAALHERPLVFALSNPTASAECTAEQAYAWSDGRAVFASGSPFAPVELGGRRFVPGQANNVYIFPAVGLGVTAVGARRVIDEMFAAAARTLADQVPAEQLAAGCLFPPLHAIRDVAVTIAAAVAEVAFEHGLATIERPADLPGFLRAQMYVPEYHPLPE